MNWINALYVPKHEDPAFVGQLPFIHIASPTPPHASARSITFPTDPASPHLDNNSSPLASPSSQPASPFIQGPHSPVMGHSSSPTSPLMSPGPVTPHSAPFSFSQEPTHPLSPYTLNPPSPSFTIPPFALSPGQSDAKGEQDSFHGRSRHRSLSCEVPILHLSRDSRRASAKPKVAVGVSAKEKWNAHADLFIFIF
eukprot:GILI01026486.1.p1 GENE.GILI01026486.1~~GILI01026486.1.p1  ORF type:complete len:230 (-),score=25.14 GILI01026486.1:419-1006(-)